MLLVLTWVMKLNTERFLRSLFRMGSRRGCAFQIVSDRWTNFIVAARERKEVMENLETNQIQQ